MTLPELDAFVAECERVEHTLAGIPHDAWSGPGLGTWNLAQLVAHLARGVERIAVYLDEPVEGRAVVDRVEYFRYDAAEAAAGVAARGVEAAAEIGVDSLTAAFAEKWRASAERVRGSATDRLLTTFRGPMRLDEYLATRVLEAVVHHMDIRAALDLPPDSDPTAARMTMSILEGLLGEPRPRNLGRTRFIQAATGRSAVDDPRFPVLG